MTQQVSDQNIPTWAFLGPPFRVVPESTRRIMRTQFIVLMPLAIGACYFFGWSAARVLALTVSAAVVTELLAQVIRQDRQPGSGTHSALLGLLVGLMLPAYVQNSTAILAGIASVAIGKHFFRGLGHYLWHPALVGRLAVQLFDHEQLSQTTSAILSRGHTCSGSLDNHGELTSWLRFDWFRQQAAEHTAWLLHDPETALQQIGAHLQFHADQAEIGQYMLQYLPTLQHLVWGAIPGEIGSNLNMPILVCSAYLIYRGYLRWQLPMLMLLTAALTALVCPVLCTGVDNTTQSFVWPGAAESALTGLVYAGYHIFSGGLIFCAFILALDTTCRPLYQTSQALFAIVAGALCVVFRLYTPLPVPAYAAMLVAYALVPGLDQFIRKHKKRQWVPNTQAAKRPTTKN